MCGLCSVLRVLIDDGGVIVPRGYTRGAAAPMRSPPEPNAPARPSSGAGAATRKSPNSPPRRGFVTGCSRRATRQPFLGRWFHVFTRTSRLAIRTKALPSPPMSALATALLALIGTVEATNKHAVGPARRPHTYCRANRLSAAAHPPRGAHTHACIRPPRSGLCTLGQRVRSRARGGVAQLLK